MKKRFNTAFIWLLLLVAFVVLFVIRDKPRQSRSFYAFRNDVAQGRVAEVQVHGNRMDVKLRDGQGKYSTLGVVDDALAEELAEQGVPVRDGEDRTWIGQVLMWILPGLVLIAVIYWFLRRTKGMSGDIFAMRKSQARQLPESAKVTFADVGGCEDAKLLLGDLVDFLREPQRWAKTGVRLPRGVLLEGPPGCGKTLLARAVAGETKAKFYLSTASEFVEMFVGVGAARVRDTFDLARKNAPAVIFIDELDAVGRRRGSGVGSSHDEREQTLNQLLVCMDGFESRDAVVVIAATNRPDILDPALVRPGRFDRRIKIPPLSRDARLQILQIHTANKQLASDVSLPQVADRTEGFSGAQLESLANEAGLLAVRRACRSGGVRPELHMDDFLEAVKPTAEQSRFLNQLDTVLIESTTQLAEPTGRAIVRAVLDGDCTVQGDLVWADANFLKIRTAQAEVIVPKAKIRHIEALDGTESADPADFFPDSWARRNPGTA